MIRYVGGKNRLSKHIAPIIQSYINTNTAYVEPFVGGGNVLAAINANTKIANDIDKAVVYLLANLYNGWIPPKTVSEKEYHVYKLLPETNPLHGWAAFACSFSGKKWGGYARTVGRDHSNEQYRAIIKHKHKFTNTTFSRKHYTKLYIPDNTVVYCDPPYAHTLQYQSKFNSKEFWKWATKLSKRCTVIISEYTAPAHFKSIYAKEVSNNVGFSQHRNIEQLFIFDKENYE